ncbi:hypothetical protein QA596_08090 [Balneolales bacterium ANBcel1]|nr:hypothetical protein [Balneolales bacterium ANBcel1]
MEKLTLIKNEKYSLFCYPKQRIVRHVLNTFVFGKDFQTLMTTGADAFIKYNCNKWLSDDRSNSALRKDDIEWGQTHWEGRILEKGWKYWALVMPEKVVGQMNMRPIIDRYANMGVEVKVFSNARQGFDWLCSKP